MQYLSSTILEFSKILTHQIGSQLLREYGQVKAEHKADGSLVTQADQWADQEIVRAIASQFPDHGILSEEGQVVFPGTEWCWVIDPIDGTTNFTRGLPMWGISLGLLYQGTPVFGYVYFPPLQQSFAGITPGFTGTQAGAWLNSRPIQPSDELPTANHFLNLCARSLPILRQPLPIPCKIRMLGVTTYDFLSVACGIALAGIEATPKIWDIAAVWAIAQAAGAVWVDLQTESVFPLRSGVNYGKKSFPTLVASTQDIADQLKPLAQTITLATTDYGL